MLRCVAFRRAGQTSSRAAADLLFPSLSPAVSPAASSTPPGPLLPCRSSSHLHNFALPNRPSPGSGSKDDNSAYSRLLRAELFGGDSFPGGHKQDCPGSNNLFRFKTDPRSSAPSPSFAEKLDCAGAGGSPTPKKAPRKVPKMPHKVLDAPSLQDDFYPNLVD